MGPLAIIAAVGVGVAAAGTYMSYKAQKKQAAFLKQSAAAQRAQDNMKAARERREAIRNARLSAGVVSQNAANQGVSGSSAELGGLGSISTQLNQGLSFLDGYNRLSDQAGRAETRAAAAAMDASKWASVANFGKTLASNAGQIAGKA